MGEHFAEEQIRDLLDEVGVLRAELAGMQLTWTSERPTVPGQYWIERPYILATVDRVDVCRIEPDHLPLADADGYRFAGPIPEPAEPAKERGGV